MNPKQLSQFLATVEHQHKAREESIGARRRLVELYSSDASGDVVESLPVVSLKTLYTDFEVREIPTSYGDGAPLVLELGSSASAKSGDACVHSGASVSFLKRPRAAEECDDAMKTAPQNAETSSAAKFSSVTEVIGPLISKEDLANLLVGLADATKTIPLRSVTEKEKRAELHKAIKACLGDTHVSNTVDGVVTVLKANAADRREERRRSRTNRTAPKYHHFTLYKENMDSNQALRMLAHHLKLSSRQLQFCGTKDKRAVTLQRAAIRETTVEHLKTINSHTFGEHSVMKVCGFTEEEHGLRLGDALGNHFRIVLRVFPAALSPAGSATPTCPMLTPPHLYEIERVVREAGVINYFGPQRFGTTKILTSDVGIQFLQGRLREGLRLLLSSKACLVPAMQRVVDFYDASDYAAALEATPYYCYSERDILKHLSRNPNDYLGSLQAIARTMAMMYFHAVQSLVWNRLASSRLSDKSRRHAEVGDLVLESTYQESVAGRDAQLTESPEACKLPAVRRLTSEEDCARFGLEDVLLPVPGPDEDLIYPSSVGCTRDDYDAVLAELGIDFTSKQALGLIKVFHFHGTYRTLGVRPKDFTLRMETVATWRTPVLKSDWQRHCEAEGIVTPALSSVGDAASVLESAGPVEVLVVAFSLPPGSYATSVLREFCIPTTEHFHRSDSRIEEE
ncbi:pseudouridine synthase, putative [Leishmania panamensis]|uniref:Pseudouridine synthase, putative n=1 Tax=Leishmania panamensis TaxID=5679 RepID=A0A088S3B9_LEIPA|nr:pseudouridine synthase, putative [Leishmania panamensis]AIO02719.1 pseudouridine synthase, putative [Leishmania panamensis]